MIYNEKTTKIIENLLNNVNLILIMPHGRSGSVFIQSLLDGHENIASFPSFSSSDTYLMNENESIEFNVDTFIAKNQYFFNSEGTYMADTNHSVSALLGENCNENFNINIIKYKKILIKISNKVKYINSKSFYILKNIALNIYLGYDIKYLKYVVFHLHNYDELLFNKLLKDFPDLYFIAAIRDPRENWNSWKNVLIRRGQVPKYHFIDVALNTLNRFENLFNDYHKFKCGHVKIIDLNRLHKGNKKIMWEISAWLSIKKDNVLLESTLLGLKWWGNDNSMKKINSFSLDKVACKFLKDLTKDEIEGQYIGLVKISKIILNKVIDFYEDLDKNKMYDGKDFNNMYTTSFIQMIINDLVDVKPMFVNGGWVEVDSIQDLKVKII